MTAISMGREKSYFLTGKVRDGKEWLFFNVGLCAACAFGIWLSGQWIVLAGILAMGIILSTLSLASSSND